MELIWKLEGQEIARLQAFVAIQSTNAFVRERIKRNVETVRSPITLERFWDVMVACLLSTQQRSGPDSPISRLIATKPFPLSYTAYSKMANADAEVQHIFKTHGGIRYSTTR